MGMSKEVRGERINAFVRRVWMLLALVLCFLSAHSGAETESITWIHTDHLGSPIMGRDADGGTVWEQNYSPWGERLSIPEVSTISEGVGYAGHYEDRSVGLVYMGARWYDPAVGRFQSPDTFRFDARNPESFNRYTYGNNSPYVYVDPDGHLAQCAPALIAGPIVGGGCAAVSTAITWAGIGALTVSIGGAADDARKESEAGGQSATPAGPPGNGDDDNEKASPLPVDPNKLKHIFGQERHNLGGLVKSFGTEEKAFNAIQQATEAAVRSNQMKGVFEASVRVGAQTVTVRGSVINGAVKIGTAFIP
jgi:RHS repeat-associated protein